MSHRWCENATFPVSSGPCLPHLSGQVQLRCSNNEGLLTAHTVRPLGFCCGVWASLSPRATVKGAWLHLYFQNGRGGEREMGAGE